MKKYSYGDNISVPSYINYTVIVCDNGRIFCKDIYGDIHVLSESDIDSKIIGKDSYDEFINHKINNNKGLYINE